MRALVVLAIVAAGCSPAPPAPIPELELYRLGAWVSFETATHDAGGGGGETIRVGDPCPDCGGTGRIGDGTIESPCDRCRGTGKIQPDDPAVTGG